MRVPDLKSIAPSHVPDPAEDTPFSCSTFASNDVNDHLRTVTLTGRGWDVCSYIHRQTFGYAVAKRRNNESELTCNYDLAKWSLALGINKSTLLRIVQRLADCKIILLNKTDGKGTITWNLSFQEWLTYDVRHPKKQRAIDLRVNTSLSESDTLNQCALDETIALNQCLPDDSHSLKSMAACVEARLEEVAPELKISSSFKNIEEEEYPMGVAHATQGKLLSSGMTDPELQAIPSPSHKPKTAGYEKDKKARPRDPLWDASVQIFGYTPATKGERGKWNSALKELREAEVTPSMLQRLADV